MTSLELPDTARFGTRHIAEVVGQSERTVRGYCRERWPDHEGWWLFTRAEFIDIVEDMSAPSAGRRRGGLRRRRR